MTENYVCPICDGPGKFYAEVTRTEFGKTVTGIYARCEHCRSAWVVNAQPDNNFYDKDYFEKFKDFVETGASEALNKCRLSFIKPAVEAYSESIIDFGCGAGDFLQYAKDQLELTHACGVEVNPAAIQFAQERFPDLHIFDGIKELLKNGPVKVDILTSFDCFEHHNHPRRIMDYFVEMLEPGGVLAISIPYFPMDDVPVEQFAAWRHCRPAQHFIHPTKRGMIFLLENRNMEMVYTGNPEDIVRRPGEDRIHSKNILTIVARKKH